MSDEMINLFSQNFSSQLQAFDPQLTYDHACGTLHLETENYFVEISLFDFERLVITFETAGLPHIRPERFRPGWGSQFLRSRRVSFAAVKPKQVDWYMRPDLHGLFFRIRAALESFRVRITYGASMGAYGALLHSNVLGADRVVAISPQTTLNRAVMPQEDRFPEARRWDWDGQFGDVINRFSPSTIVFLIFDPFDKKDCAHVSRLKGHNFNLIHVPFGGHRIPVVLKKAQVLGSVVDLCLTGEMNFHRFYHNLRLCRLDKDRLARIEKKAINHPYRLRVIREAMSRSQVTE